MSIEVQNRPMDTGHEQHTAPLCHNLAAGTRIFPGHYRGAPVFRGE